MPRIIVDGKEIECRDHVPVLQAVLEAGWDVPHYCYHPGLTVVASCRLCLMEMKMPHPQTKELGWAPKLFPSCQTPVRDGMEVRFNSEAVRGNQQHVMEYYLLNHPLDCPVCDKAGECYLQDYSEKFGHSTSRMVEDKYKNPKKDIGSRTLLYQDRCVLCTRCVRFCQEVAGPGELTVVDRGSRSEIDVFPGVPLENPLQGNVVDLCPVGALLDKGFLFKQRVWLLRSTPSVSPADSSGATIWIDHNEEGVHRIRPRFNEKVNAWWISDEQRFDWKYVYRDDRVRQPMIRRGPEWQAARWEELPAVLRFRFAEIAKADRGAAVAAVLSPMMSCEEAWLLARFIRAVAPQAGLVLGPAPVVGEDQSFPRMNGPAAAVSASGFDSRASSAAPAKFTLRAEKCPNRRGVERIVAALGGPTMGWDDFVKAASKIKAAYVVGGYPAAWIKPDVAKGFGKVEFLVVHDLFPNPLDAVASVRIPGASWMEREGTFMNRDGLVQPFERAIQPLEGVKADGQFLLELAGEGGLFRAARVREHMAQTLLEFATPFTPRPAPPHAH